MVAQAERVVIGMDPHKRSVTIGVIAGDETILGRHGSGPRVITGLQRARTHRFERAGHRSC